MDIERINEVFRNLSKEICYEINVKIILHENPSLLQAVEELLHKCEASRKAAEEVVGEVSETL